MKVANAVAEILKREGIEFLIGYPVNPIIEAAAEADIRSGFCRPLSLPALAFFYCVLVGIEPPPRLPCWRAPFAQPESGLVGTRPGTTRSLQRRAMIYRPGARSTPVSGADQQNSRDRSGRRPHACCGGDSPDPGVTPISKIWCRKSADRRCTRRRDCRGSLRCELISLRDRLAICCGRTADPDGRFPRPTPSPPPGGPRRRLPSHSPAPHHVRGKRTMRPGACAGAPLRDHAPSAG